MNHVLPYLMWKPYSIVDPLRLSPSSMTSHLPSPAPLQAYASAASHGRRPSPKPGRPGVRGSLEVEEEEEVG
jgi:hypothetical protein